MSVYDIVNEKLLAAMKDGIIPWEKPWRCTRTGNPVTGHPYHGINIMLTGIHNLIHEVSSPHFLSFKQISMLGGQVEKGQKGCMIVYFKFIESKKDPGKEIPMLRYFNVWNMEQTTLPKDLFTAPEPHIKINPFEWMYGYEGGPAVSYDQPAQAFYRPDDDSVHMPEEGRFFTENSLKQTLFHELAHSTGHETRLNRKDSYAKEELTAEMASAFMMHECGFEPNYENSAAYLDSWAKRVADDKTLFVSAAGKAEKAVKYIIDRPKVEEKVG